MRIIILGCMLFFSFSLSAQTSSQICVEADDCEIQTKIWMRAETKNIKKLKEYGFDGYAYYFDEMYYKDTLIPSDIVISIIEIFQSEFDETTIAEAKKDRYLKEIIAAFSTFSDEKFQELLKIRAAAAVYRDFISVENQGNEPGWSDSWAYFWTHCTDCYDCYATAHNGYEFLKLLENLFLLKHFKTLDSSPTGVRYHPIRFEDREEITIDISWMPERKLAPSYNQYATPTQPSICTQFMCGVSNKHVGTGFTESNDKANKITMIIDLFYDSTPIKLSSTFITQHK
ncbi:MAG: hypothetical protein KDK51_00880 [Deltaproteobacteria bacterium]|nr:hypothetical protein [Deltaproteobacteria bacterium]